MLMLGEIESKHGPVHWEKHLPEGKITFSAREVCNAIGKALTEKGIPNNLEKK